MIIIAILVSLVGIAALCWLLFNLAVFALPFFASMAAGTWAHDTGAGIPGAGIPGAIIVGAIAAGLTLGLFQLLLLVALPAWIKLLVIFAFVAPAAVAGYYATFGIVKLTMPSETWQLTFAIFGAVAVGITAFMRLTIMTRPPFQHTLATSLVPKVPNHEVPAGPTRSSDKQSEISRAGARWKASNG